MLHSKRLFILGSLLAITVQSAMGEGVQTYKGSSNQSIVRTSSDLTRIFELRGTEQQQMGEGKTAYKTLQPIRAQVKQTVLTGAIEHRAAAGGAESEGRSAALTSRSGYVRQSANSADEPGRSAGISGRSLPAVIQYHGSRLKSELDEKQLSGSLAQTELHAGTASRAPLPAIAADGGFAMKIRKDWLLTDAQMSVLPEDIQEVLRARRRRVPACGPCDLVIEERLLKEALESNNQKRVDRIIEQMRRTPDFWQWNP